MTVLITFRQPVSSIWSICLKEIHLQVLTHCHLMTPFPREIINAVCLSGFIQFWNICLHFAWSLSGRLFRIIWSGLDIRASPIVQKVNFQAGQIKSLSSVEIYPSTCPRLKQKLLSDKYWKTLMSSPDGPGQQLSLARSGHLAPRKVVECLDMHICRPEQHVFDHVDWLGLSVDYFCFVICTWTMF